MFEKKLELQNALVEAEEALNQHTVELADAGAVQGYVEELRKLLESSEIMEQKTFLRSFVEGVEVGGGEVTVKYKIPFVDGGGDGERVGVLPFIQDGSPASKSFRFVPDFHLIR